MEVEEEKPKESIPISEKLRNELKGFTDKIGKYLLLISRN